MSKSVRKNYLYNSAYQAFQIITPLVTTPYLSRVLGAGGIGTYSYTYAVANYFVMFATLGMSQYGVRAIASVGDDRQARSRVFCSAYASQLVVSGIVAVAYVVYAIVSSAEDFAVIVWWLPWVLSCVFNVTWLFFGLEDFRRTTLISLVIKAVEFACIFIFVRSSADTWIYVALTAASYFFNQVLLWPIVKQYVDFVRPTASEIIGHFKPNALLFIPVVAISLYTTLNTVFLGAFSTAEQTAYFSYSEKLCKMPLTVITALTSVMLPRVSNAFAKGEKSETLDLLETSMWFMTVMAFALSFGIFAVAPEFAPVFLGDEFVDSVPVMELLAWIIPLICVSNVLGTQYLLPSFRDKLYTLTVCAGAVINIILCAFLIPRCGAMGAAVGAVAAEALVLLLQATIVRKELPLGSYCLSAVPFLCIGFIMAFIVRLISPLLIDEFDLGALSLLFEVALSAFVYAGLSLAWCLFTRNKFLLRILGRNPS